MHVCRNKTDIKSIYSIVAFKVDAFYVFIIKEILNESTS